MLKATLTEDSYRRILMSEMNVGDLAIVTGVPEDIQDREGTLILRTHSGFLMLGHKWLHGRDGLNMYTADAAEHYKVRVLGPGDEVRLTF